MEPDHRPRSRRRENFIILTLTLFVGGLVLFFLDLVTMGIFSYAIATAGGVVLLGCFHYLLWGRTLSDEVAGQRQALQLQEEPEVGVVHVDPAGFQDLSRRRGIQRRRGTE